MLLDHIFLLEDLHGIDLLIEETADEQDLGIGALADDGDRLVVLYACFFHIM
jgi:hypothetical protein